MKKSRCSYCSKCRNRSQLKTTAIIATFTWRQSCATAELSHVPCSIWIISGSQSVRNIWKYSNIRTVDWNICLFDICLVYFHINMFRYSFVPFFHDEYVPFMYLDVMISPRRWRAIVSGQGSWEKMFQWLFSPISSTLVWFCSWHLSGVLRKDKQK